ncbi:Lysophospholipid transporter LplT [Arsenophonus endosymbiont of Aleurodicus floccissimus]|nr:Lysophospholipid transporter LplT [Arsenophonus endosymbiont of Aleurodicus floccissimus]
MKDLIVSPPLLTRGIKALLLSQFFSAFADNALLFVILAQLKATLYFDWSQPILQVVFIFTYIIVSAFCGTNSRLFCQRSGHVILILVS